MSSQIPLDLEIKINNLFNEIVSSEPCPLLDKKIERLKVEKLFQFLATEKLSIDSDPTSNLYTPLEIFKKIRDKYGEHKLFLQTSVENVDHLKKELKKKYDSDKSGFNQDLLNNIIKCTARWEGYSQQEAINAFHSLILSIYACDFEALSYKNNFAQILPHPKNLIEKFKNVKIFDRISGPSK